MPDSFAGRPLSLFSAGIASVILRPLLAMKTPSATPRTLRILRPKADELLLVFEQTPPARVLHHS
jgi:hypothetical protein